MLPENPLGALQDPELGALHVDLEQRDPIACVEIFVERYHRHRQGRETFRLLCQLSERRAGLMALRDEQVLIAGMRIDGFGFDVHVGKLDRPADIDECPRQLRLRLERDHPTIPTPAR